MSDENIQKLFHKNYLTMIENSIGTNMFRNYYVRFRDSGIEKDIMDDGDKSCAVFVSAVLYLNGLIKKPHATVDSVVKDLEESGWQKTDNPKRGDVVTWEEKESNTHIGFYWSENEAISNYFIDKTPVKHDLTYNGTRKITAIYTKEIQE
jgi:hypothetical protein